MMAPWWVSQVSVAMMKATTTSDLRREGFGPPFSLQSLLEGMTAGT